MQIEPGCTVHIHYTLTDNEGNVIDSSAGHEPLVYVAGAGEIIPGLDNALLGKQAGDHADVKVSPEEGYGERIEEAVQQVEKAQLAHLPGLEVGMPLQAETPNGPISFVVVEIGEDNVILDGNHPLAGVELNFSVDVVNVAEGEAPKEASRIIVDY